MLERTIVSPFSILGKTTAGKLASLQMILQTLTADALPGTGVVAAVAFLEVLFFITLHQSAFNAPVLLSLLLSRQSAAKYRGV
jgi:hypothetical protein